MRNKNITNRHYMHFDIAGFTYWDGCIVFDQLRIGSKLHLVGETDNRFDPYAVAIYYEDYKLGFVPRTENRQLSKLIEMGYADIFDVRINRITPELHPENQVSVIVYLTKNDR